VISPLSKEGHHIGCTSMSWLDLSSKIDAFKRELDGVDEAISHAIRDRTALQA
jgi:hypothetical protein